MAITPHEDKDAFWYRIRNDPWIDKRLGLTGMTESGAAAFIRKQRQVDDKELKGNVRFVLIFDPPSNEARGPFEQSIIQVDVLMAAAHQDRADQILQQIIALCGEQNPCGWKVNGRYVTKVVKVGDLASAAGFYRCGARFYYYSATPTELQTL